MVIQLNTKKDEIKRDRYGRYLLPDPETGEIVAWTRATTVAKKADDDGTLRNYDRRMIALGLTGSPDLLAMVAACSPDDRRELDEVCEIAYDRGGGTAKARQGTANHKLIERVIKGELAMKDIPSQYRPDIEAFFREVERCGFDIEVTELVVLNPLIASAGTTDLGLRSREDGFLYVGDYKSGNVHYAWDGIGVQLAIYTKATHAWVNGELRDITEMGIRTDRAFIFHGPYGTGECQCYEVSGLDGVWPVVEAATAIRAWRGQGKKLATLYKAEPDQPKVDPPAPTPLPAAPPVPPPPLPPAAPATNPMPSGEWRVWAIERISCMDDAGMEMLGELWPSDIPTFAEVEEHTLEQREVLTRVIHEVERERELPFVPEPPKITPASEVPRFRQRLEALPADIHRALDAWGKENGIPNLLTGEATAEHVRAVEGALCDLEAAHWDRVDSWERQIREIIVDGPFDEIVRHVGQASGKLDECTRLQAEAVIAIAHALGNLNVGHTGDHQRLFVVEENAKPALTEKYGDARGVTAAAAEWAKQLGLAAPKTLKAVLESVTLTSVLLHGNTN